MTFLPVTPVKHKEIRRRGNKRNHKLSRSEIRRHRRILLVVVSLNGGQTERRAPESRGLVWATRGDEHPSTMLVICTNLNEIMNRASAQARWREVLLHSLETHYAPVLDYGTKALFDGELYCANMDQSLRWHYRMCSETVA